MAQKVSRREELAQEGVLEAVYTSKWFLKIKEALSIGLIQFSFVMKGNAKEQHFDVYMAYDRFRSWLKDFTRDSRYGQRVLAAERGEGQEYPRHYLYVTGEKGSKTVGIANSTSEGAYVINGSTVKDGKKVYANVQIKEIDSFFESLDFWLSVIDGRINPAESSYIAKVKDVYMASATERAKHFKAPAADTTEYRAEEEETNEPELEPETPETETKVEVKVVSPSEAKPEVEGKDKGKENAVKVMNFITSGELFFVDTEAEAKKAEQDRTTKLAAYVRTAPKEMESKLSEIIFYKTQRGKVLDWYEWLKNITSQKQTAIKIKAKPCGERNGRNQYVFQGIVKVSGEGS